jgi:hypothetical protein
MIKLAYYGLLSACAIILLASVIYYLVKPAPTGDSSVGWATGIIYLAALAGIVLIAALFWRNKTIGLIILCLPLLFLALPALKGRLTDLYAWLPTSRAAPLTLHIANNTRALVNVKIECWFGGKDSDQHSLYKTLEFTSKPLAVDQHKLSDYDAGLLSTKSGFVRIVFYECTQETGNGYTYVREIQPSMHFQDVPITEFQKKDFLIAIDGEKNSDAFKSEVARLKKDSMYTNGAF